VLNETFTVLNKKFEDREKLFKLFNDKLSALIEDRKAFLLQENEKRNKIVQECEEYVRELQGKYERDLPEKQLLIQENQNLRQEIETYISESMTIKDTIENKLQNKDVHNDQEAYKDNMRKMIEAITGDTQRHFLENIELKKQLPFYKQKVSEMTETVGSYTSKYNEFIGELEKVKYLNNFRKKKRLLF
jgi:hypothetical protein